ncbi:MULTISPECIES: Na/Pi cotransporter family protein [Cyanophyceae]|uniref:Na/Pi cotransporter family protein n=1 Tax=Cyanophyceae TaxID=3028117 RepID=UPI001682784C|nr:Na/Pi symporter [Coleofasciculus sp. FACHB-125]MBD1901912.1 Na/Pi cotransporter family protein [Coleofasciculus sp. FACHB-125]
MLFSKNSKKKILKLLGLSLVVTALIVSPSLSGNNFHLFNAPALEVSVNAQPPAGTDAAQQNPASAEGEEKGKSDKAESASSEGEKKGKIDIFKIVMGVLAGLVLFLYGVTRLAEGLEAIAGDRAKNLIDKFTSNRFAAVATGTVATTILDSSSVTIIMTIAMVSAGLLTFVQSLGVVLGSNIGTTIGAELIAFKINEYAPIALFLGLLLHFLGKTDRWKNIGLILLGVGLLFFGLDTIDEAMKPFRDYQPFIDWMKTLGENPLLGALVGALFTVLIQSSSATVAIVITLAASGLISLPAGIALMLGAEVGTCADTLVATIGRSREAVRTGVFHVIFNVITAVVGILFAAQLASLAQWISGGADVARQIANAQVIFNVLGVVLVIGFLPLIARGLEMLIPGGKSNRQLAGEPQREQTKV